MIAEFARSVARSLARSLARSVSAVSSVASNKLASFGCSFSSILYRRFSLRLLRRSVDVTSTGTFDVCEVLLEAGDDRREVVDCEYRLLLEECVAYARGRVTVMRRPYVMGDWTVLG